MTQSDFIARFGAADPREVYAYGIDQYFRLMEQRDALKPLHDEIKQIAHELDTQDLLPENREAMVRQRDILNAEFQRRRVSINAGLFFYRRSNKAIDLLANAPTVGGRGIQQDGADRQEVAA